MRPLRVVASTIPPYVQLVKENKQLTIKGIYGSILEYLQRGLNFNYTIIPKGPGQFGRRQPDGSYTGMLGILHRYEADILITPYTLTAEDVSEFEYVPALFHNHLHLFASHSIEPKTNLFSFVRAFETKIWIILLVTIILIAFISALADQLMGDRKLWPALQDYLFIYPRLFLLNGLPSMAKFSLPVIVLLGFWLMANNVFHHAIGGTLKSFIMIRDPPERIDTLEQLLARKDLRLRFWDFPVFLDHVKNAKNPRLKAIYQRIMDDDGMAPVTYMYGSQFLYDVLEKNVVGFNHAERMGYLINNLCNELPLGKRRFYFSRLKIYPHWAVLIWSRQLEPEISKAIFKKVRWMVDAGFMEYWIRQIWENFERCMDLHGTVAEKAVKMSLQDLAGIFYIWLLMLAFSSVVLIIEIIVGTKGRVFFGDTI